MKILLVAPKKGEIGKWPECNPRVNVIIALELLISQQWPGIWNPVRKEKQNWSHLWNDETQKEKFFHLLVEGRYLPEYWMHLLVTADISLKKLDTFLRDIWLECCGHLSAYTIEDKTYSIMPMRELREKKYES